MALVRHRPDWALGFDPSARGFVRSFLAQLLAVPFYLVAAAMVARVQAPDGERVTLWASALSDMMDVVAYPLVVAAFARPLRIGAGYSGFIVVVNWSSLLLSVLQALFSLAALFGREGYAVFGTA